MSGFPDKVRASDKVLALLRDPDFMIEAFRVGWEDTGNPVEVWDAIARCAKHKRPLPDWVMGYLADVAQRMTSADARAATDLRKVLPRIMGFPAKPGPGHPLDPHSDKNDVTSLAIRFAIEIERGCEPSAALRNAAVSLPPDIANRDDRTLWRWLMQYVGLERRPSTNAEWRAELRSLYGSLVALGNLVARYREQESRETLALSTEQESRETLA